MLLLALKASARFKNSRNALSPTGNFSWKRCQQLHALSHRQLCSVYACFHWKMDIPGKDNCYRRIILPTGRYDQKHTDSITDRPIVTRRQRQKPACSTPSCRQPWPDQSCEGPGTRAGTFRENVSAIDKADRRTAAIARTSM